MTRSHKANDRDHKGLADGTAGPQEHLPRFFTKNGPTHQDPKKVKKHGSGRGNWGGAGHEVVDEQFNFTNARRRSNSSGYSNNLHNFKTKFDFNEDEPVFEESLHGPIEESEAETDADSMELDLVKMDSFESSISSVV